MINTKKLKNIIINLKKADQKKVLAIVGALLAAAIILVVLFTASSVLRKKIGTEGRLDSQAVSQGITYGIPSDSVIDMKMVDGGAVILSDSELIFINEAGKFVRRYQHKYDKPAISVFDATVIVYNRGGNSYTIEKRNKRISEGTTERAIITAVMGNSGYYAISTRAVDAFSELSVYNRSGDIKFRWRCSQEHIINLSLSPNKKTIAAAVIGSADAHIYSRVFIFDFDYSEPYAVFDYTNSSVFSVKYTKAATLHVYTDKEKSIIVGKEKKDTVFDVEEPRMLTYSPNGKAAFLSSRFGNDSTNLLSVYDKDGVLLFNKPIEENVKALSNSNSGVNLLFNDRSETYNYKGELIGSVELGNESVSSIISSGELFVLSPQGINRYNAGSIIKEKSSGE